MIDRWLTRHSITALRVCMGVVIFIFGFVKYFPGVSPAQGLVLAVNRILTFGLLPDRVSLVLFATVESLLGLSLITGYGLRVTIYPLALWALAILSPLVLLTGLLFSGPDHALTLLGQYVFKDIILLAAVLVIATGVRQRPSTQGFVKAAERLDELEVGGVVDRAGDHRDRVGG
jgi:hypothetical protein